MEYNPQSNITTITSGTATSSILYFKPCGCMGGYSCVHYWTPSIPDAEFDYYIKKAENGFVLKHGYKEYVFKTIAEMSKFLEKEIK